MGLFLLKLTLTPLLLALATLASRRWGPMVGGWIVGLPLTSGPVSAFLALEQGKTFAADAALGAVLCAPAIIAYAMVYARLAKKVPWTVAVPIALCTFTAAILALSLLTVPLAGATALSVGLTAAALYLEKPTTARSTAIPAPWWDIPFRMLTATVVVVTITALSASLGPRLSGLLSAFPVFICVMSAFSHKLSGPESVRGMARGIIMATFSFITFFLTVALTVQHLNLFLVYTLAVLAAGCVNMGTVFVLGRKKTH
ncbi:hypothetical protein LJC26_02610 [Desulfovibrio sp. OttesenSCG-928-O18]|nr:hypothetical protein [Desulfovibrio sp. OttesenSCG-928-O18]